MYTTKHQIVRHHKLDRCFQNYGREYTIEDLLDAVNESILDFDPKSTGVQVANLRKDISFMRSPAGYDAPIETYRGANGFYYRYSDKAFSINKSPLNDTEAEQLKKAVSILQRFEGSPEFEWVNEIAPLLNDKFGLKGNDKKVMSLESNIDYAGYAFITPLFNAIINKCALYITYEPFHAPSYQIAFHPYYLKQYNSRWFVFGFNEYNDNNRWNLALDRIRDITQRPGEIYIPDLTDWEDFFEDMIGVSKDPDKSLEVVHLTFTADQAPYILTKPLHWSQKTKELEDGSLEARINVIINYELEMMILSYGEKVKVTYPQSLVDTISKRIQQLLEKY